MAARSSTRTRTFLVVARAVVTIVAHAAAHTSNVESTDRIMVVKSKGRASEKALKLFETLPVGPNETSRWILRSPTQASLYRHEDMALAIAARSSAWLWTMRTSVSSSARFSTSRGIVASSAAQGATTVSTKKAALMIIGDEILSGSIQDTNTACIVSRPQRPRRLRAPRSGRAPRGAPCVSPSTPPPYTSLPHSHVSFLSSSHGWLRFFAHGASTWSPSK